MYCGLITNRSSVFRNCIAIDEDAANRFFQNCAYDGCQNPDNMHPATCGNVAAFAEDCRENGVIVNTWREASGCGKTLAIG